jgi:hypothetical protein
MFRPRVQQRFCGTRMTRDQRALMRVARWIVSIGVVLMILAPVLAAITRDGFRKALREASKVPNPDVGAALSAPRVGTRRLT